MKVALVLALAIVLVGCGGRPAQQAPPAAQPSPPSAPESPAPESAAPTSPETPAPAAPETAAPAQPAPPSAGGGPGVIQYPGSKETSRSSWSGTGPSGGAGNWTTATFETTDPYERVRDFYKANAPKGWQQSFVNEQSSDKGRTFAMWMTRSDEKAWYTVNVSEEKSTGKIMIVTAYGVTQ